MAIFKTKVWSWIDIAFLKWSSVLFGMAIGAHVSAFVKHYLWGFIILVIICALRPFYSYWVKE